MVPFARDEPAHWHAHSRSAVLLLAFVDQQDTEAVRKQGSKITFQLPHRKPPARAPSGPPHALQTEAHDPMRFADIVALIKAPDSKKQRVLRKSPTQVAILPPHGIQVGWQGSLAYQLPLTQVEIEILLQVRETLPQCFPQTPACGRLEMPEIRGQRGCQRVKLHLIEPIATQVLGRADQARLIARELALEIVYNPAAHQFVIPAHDVA